MHTIAARNRMLDGTYTPPTHIAAFDGDPESGGVEQGRVAITWNPAANGEKSQAEEPEIPVSAGSKVNYIGFFDAGTGGTLLAKDDVTEETFTNDGIYIVKTAVLDLNLTA